MHKRMPQKGLAPLERRVPKNEKYAHVRGTLDTGMTIEKVKFVTAREYSKRRDEIFFRLNKNQLYELLSEYEGDEYESIAETANNSLRIVSYSDSAGPVYDKPYLILDVREVDYFNQYHVLQARSFPYTMLRRDQMHPEIYRFRNKPETLIIVCCDDEKMSRESAKVLVDRGVDNVFLLTGGIQEFANEYPGFIEGQLPAPPKSATKAPRKASSTLGRIGEDEEGMGSPGKSTTGSQLTPGKLDRHNRTYAPAASSSGAGTFKRDAYAGVTLNSVRGSPGGAGGRGMHSSRRSDAGMSTTSNKSVAESVISRAASRKGKF